MRIVIMADGRGARWQGHLRTSKHLAEINGEPLIYRTIRLLRTETQKNTEIIVTSHDKRYEFDGCKRYEPRNNVLEIDRFTEELIENNMYFLYGDTYYTENAVNTILHFRPSGTTFFGNQKSIVAIWVSDSEEFKRHKNRIRQLFIDGKINECRGWQIYQSFTDQDVTAPFGIKDRFIFIDDETADINTAEDYKKLL